MHTFALVALCGLAVGTAVLAGATKANSVSPLQVRFPNVSPDLRPLLLYSGERSGQCRTYEPHASTTFSSITITDVSYDASCSIELDVFAPSRGAFGRKLLGDIEADVAGVKKVLASETLDIELPELVTVSTTAWIVAGGAVQRATAEALFHRQYSSAVPILAELGAGFALDTPTPKTPTGNIDPNCNASDVLSTTAGSYDPQRINIYYVKNYRNQQNSSYGFNCWKHGHPEIVFISWGNKYTSDVVLAHELGHALGLFHPKVKGGHTSKISGFDEFNLMVSGASSITNISLGQSYEMNFGTDSWLNRKRATTPPVLRPCQDSWSSGVCPSLSLFLNGWPTP